MNRLVVLALLGLAAGCHGPSSDAHASPATPQSSAASQAAPVQVSLAKVTVQPMPRYLTLTGSVTANHQSDVAANVSGRIVNTYVERGQKVKRGELLALVDSRTAGLSASAAAAQANAAQTQEALAQADCDRADKLYAKGVMTAADHDRAKAQCSAQVFQAKAAAANAALAQKLAGDTAIRAPFDGVVGERFVNVGEYVQPPTKVATLYSTDPVRVQVSVPEAAVAKVQKGQMLQVEVGAYGDRAFPARVEYVSPALRPATRDLIVEALADNPDGALKAGMFGVVQLQVGEETLPTVPKTALQVEGTVKRLFVAKDGHAVEKVVRTGVEKDGRVALLGEDLSAQDPVIDNPPAALEDGAAIR
jgi:membrane fusion protein (multidrug efflux system)